MVEDSVINEGSSTVLGCLIALYGLLRFHGSLTIPTSGSEADGDLLKEDIKSAGWWFDLVSIRKR